MTTDRGPAHPEGLIRPIPAGFDGGTGVLGIVVAGGLSTRMGRDKAFLTIGPATLAQRAVDRLRPQVGHVAFNGDTVGTALPADVPVLGDAVPGHLGPLAGILAGLRLAEARGFAYLATVAVDTPFFPRDLVGRLAGAMAGAQATIAVAASNGSLHPVFGLWSSTLADPLQTFIDTDDKRRVRGFIERQRHVVVDFACPDGAADPFLNINRPEDLDAARRILAEHEDDRT